MVLMNIRQSYHYYNQSQIKEFNQFLLDFNNVLHHMNLYKYQMSLFSEIGVQLSGQLFPYERIQRCLNKNQFR